MNKFKIRLELYQGKSGNHTLQLMATGDLTCERKNLMQEIKREYLRMLGLYSPKRLIVKIYDGDEMIYEFDNTKTQKK